MIRAGHWKCLRYSVGWKGRVGGCAAGTTVSILRHRESELESEVPTRSLFFPFPSSKPDRSEAVKSANSRLGRRRKFGIESLRSPETRGCIQTIEGKTQAG